MLNKNLSIVTLLSLLLTACVTINVYFPAAEAKEAADKIIDKVWGNEQGTGEQLPPESQPNESTDESVPPVDEGTSPQEPSSAVPNWMLQTLNFLISPAQAGINIDISSPAIQELQARMSQRHQELLQYYNNGAIGLTNDALIVLRDPSKVSLRFRKRISDLVNEENGDRLRLYREIAYANGHPEWEANIRDTFAIRWIERAMVGWWYQDEDGNWLRKQPPR